MAVLSNINDKFAVDSTGAIKFNGQVGTSGYILKSNGNTAPTWVDPDTVIGGPYLPLTGGTLTGNLAINGTNSLSVGGTLTVGGNNVVGFSGSWNGANMPGSRWNGYSVNGGEIVFQRDNPNSGQMSILVDGGYYAGENNGFYSLYSSNSYNSKAGFYADTSGVLQFNASAAFAGDVLVEDNLYLTDAGTVRGKIQLNSSDRDNLDIKAVSLGSEINFFTVDTLALTLDANQNATFASAVWIPDYIYHVGDADSKFGFGGNNNYNINLGGDNVLDFYQTVLYLKKPTEVISPLSVKTGNDLRLYRSDNATYARFNYAGSSVGLDIDDLNGDGINLQQAGVNKLRIETNGNATFAGDVEIAANLFSTGNNLKFHAAGTHVMNIDLNGKVYPNTHNAYDLGYSTSLAWRNLYLSGTATIPTIASNTNFTGDIYQYGSTFRTSSFINLLNNRNTKKYLETAYFTNGVSNQAVNIQFINAAHQGFYKITLSGSYSNQDISGKLTKVIPFGYNPNGSIWRTGNNQSEITIATGGVSTNFTIGNLAWDSTNSKFIIPIYKLTSTGNSVKILVEYLGGAANNLKDVTLSSNYTQAAPSPFNVRQYRNIRDRLGIGTTNPATKLEVNGGLIKVVDSGDTAFYGGDYVRVFGTQSYGFRNSAGSAIAQISLTGNSYFNGGNVGIGTTSPFSKLQVGNNTFSGGNGMHNDTRVGISNHGILTGMMLASTYNDAAHPEYGLVFVQGPSTSSYNVWSISPDGPAKGSGLIFNYQAQSTNIHSPANAKVCFQGASGNVGIGTISPQDKLNLHTSSASGNIGMKITRGTETHGLRLGVNSSHAFLWTTEAQNLVFATSGIQRISILSGGNVGIGTTNPTAPLMIAGSGADGTAMLRLEATAGSTTFNWISSVIYPNLAAGKTAIKLFGQAQSTNNQAWMGFKYAGSGSTSNMLTFGFYANNFLVNLLANGNLGIGTDSPTSKLHVFGGSANTELKVTTNDNFIARLGLYEEKAGNVHGGFIQYRGESGDRLELGSRNSGTDTVHMSIDDVTGNVGIGNISPQTTLHVGTTTTVTNQFTNQVNASNFFVNGNANGGASFFQCKTAAVNINMMGNNDFACNQFTFYHKPLSTSQNVVGTIATFSSSTQYNTTSDYRLKENVIPLSDSIIRLKQLKPSRFNFIEDPERTMDGFLAHEVQNTVPEAVNGKKDAVDENGNEVHQGIDQAKLVPLLVAAVQELEARVKELENK